MTSLDTHQNSQPRIAFIMEDEYAWDLVRTEQLSGVEFRIFNDCLSWSEETLTERLRGITAMVSGRKSPRIPDALIADPGDLTTLIHCHGGVRQLVKEEHLRSGITVTNWGKGAGRSVAEGALGLMLACLKQMPSLQAFSESGKEQDPRMYQTIPDTLFGAKIGLYGFGPIGQHMAKLLAPFSPRLAIYDPYAAHVPAGAKVCTSLEELFDHSDIVSIHCGLNDATRDSITSELLDRLPQGGAIVNTARGDIVDEAALAERVHAGRLLAGIDVIRNGTPWAQTPLLGTRNAIVTAHKISTGKGPDPANKPPKLLADFVVKNVQAVWRGSPLVNVISPDEYALKT